MRASHFFLYLLLMSATTLNAEKPFDFATTPGKLPKNVVPKAYAIRISPDVEKRTFSSSESIQLEDRKPARQSVLNAPAPKIETASVRGNVIPSSPIKTNAQQ